MNDIHIKPWANGCNEVNLSLGGCLENPRNKKITKPFLWRINTETTTGSAISLSTFTLVFFFYFITSLPRKEKT